MMLTQPSFDASTNNDISAFKHNLAHVHTHTQAKGNLGKSSGSPLLHTKVGAGADRSL